MSRRYTRYTRVEIQIREEEYFFSPKNPHTSSRYSKTRNPVFSISLMRSYSACTTASFSWQSLTFPTNVKQSVVGSTCFPCVRSAF